MTTVVRKKAAAPAAKPARRPAPELHPRQGRARKVHDGGLFDRRGDVTLGIDQSYTGFAITALDPLSRTHFSWLFTSKETGVARLVDIQAFLYEVLEELREALRLVTRIVHEGYAFGAKQGREAAGELVAAMRLALAEYYGLEKAVAVPLVTAPPTLKKYITGRGTGVKKQQVLLQTYKKWGIEYDDDNLADSYGLARMAAGLIDHKYEEEAIETMLKKAGQ